jgi:CoA-transferase family III
LQEDQRCRRLSVVGGSAIGENVLVIIPSWLDDAMHALAGEFVRHATALGIPSSISAIDGPGLLRERMQYSASRPSNDQTSDHRTCMSGSTSNSDSTNMSATASTRTSMSGNSHILPTRDSWIAITLSRPSDFAALPAWLGDGTEPLMLTVAQSWPEVASIVASVVRQRSSMELVEQGRLLSLAVASLSEAQHTHGHCSTDRTLGGAPRKSIDELRVLDLTALWAGPLCGRLLSQLGAHVTKVESTGRPDALRNGSPQFFKALNANKSTHTIDITRPFGIEELRTHINTADIVIESSRPRALEQLGIFANQVVQSGGPRIWASITGYGRSTECRDRVAFGDDAAFAAGLVHRDANNNPIFVGDAIADPITGITAANEILKALATNTHGVLDISLVGAARSVNAFRPKQ